MTTRTPPRHLRRRRPRTLRPPWRWLRIVGYRLRWQAQTRLALWSFNHGMRQFAPDTGRVLVVGSLISAVFLAAVGGAFLAVFNGTPPTPLTLEAPGAAEGGPDSAAPGTPPTTTQGGPWPPSTATTPTRSSSLASRSSSNTLSDSRLTAISVFPPSTTPGTSPTLPPSPPSSPPTTSPSTTQAPPTTTEPTRDTTGVTDPPTTTTSSPTTTTPPTTEPTTTTAPEPTTTTQDPDGRN